LEKQKRVIFWPHIVVVVVVVVVGQIGPTKFYRPTNRRQLLQLFLSWVSSYRPTFLYRPTSRTDKNFATIFA